MTQTFGPDHDPSVAGGYLADGDALISDIRDCGVRLPGDIAARCVIQRLSADGSIATLAELSDLRGNNRFRPRVFVAEWLSRCGGSCLVRCFAFVKRHLSRHFRHAALAAVIAMVFRWHSSLLYASMMKAKLHNQSQFRLDRPLIPLKSPSCLRADGLQPLPLGRDFCSSIPGPRRGYRSAGHGSA